MSAEQTSDHGLPGAAERMKLFARSPSALFGLSRTKRAASALASPCLPSAASASMRSRVASARAHYWRVRARGIQQLERLAAIPRTQRGARALEQLELAEQRHRLRADWGRARCT